MVPNFRCENGASPLSYSHDKNLVRIAFCVLWRIWGEALTDFYHKNKAKFVEFSLWKFGNNSKHTQEVSIETTPFPDPNLKAQFA